MKKTLLFITATTISLASFAQCSDLYFSEYIEGSGINKALEIYNPTSASIDLSNYSVELYANGASAATSTLPLSGMLSAGEVYVIANPDSQIDAAISAQKDTSNAVAGFSGDDAIALVKGTTKIDIIGVIGVDPGASWSVDTGSTKEYTLVRKAAINEGNINWIGDGDTEWIAYSQDNFSFLGTHTADACGANNIVTAVPMVDKNDVCPGVELNFSENSTGGATPYTYSWDFGDGSANGTTSSVSHSYAVAGTYNVVLTITDQSFIGETDDSTIVVYVFPCTSIKEFDNGDINVYPNPSKDGLINLSNVANNSTISVFNVIGEIVFSSTVNNSNQLDLSNLNKGSYFVSIANKNNRITKKLIIE